MTIHYPDISAFQKGLDLKGAPAVQVKATEGTGYFSDTYTWHKTNAASHGCYFIGYHFLLQGNVAAQAQFCHSHVGATPLSLDVEAEGSSKPGLSDAVGFIDAYRKLGGKVHLIYLPHWYWQGSIGAPSLAPLVQRDIHLHSSAYTTYTDSDSGIGWQPYGGMKPAIWQYTDHQGFNGMSVDFSAFRGTVAQLRSLATGGSVAVAHDNLPLKQGSSGPRVTQLQRALRARGDWVDVDGKFGPKTTTAVKLWQHSVKRSQDGQMQAADWNMMFPTLNMKSKNDWPGATKALQKELNNHGYQLTIDGNYDAKTQGAVGQFQRQHGLTSDGICGPQTWAKLAST